MYPSLENSKNGIAITQVNLMVIIGDVFLVIIMVELTLENGGTGLVAPHITLSVKHRNKEIQIIYRLFLVIAMYLT